MANVWFFTAADDGASWYRADLPADALTWAGHRAVVTVTPIPSVIARSDVIVASRPARPEALKILRDARERYGARIVADLDDDYWSITPDQWAYGQWHEEGLIRGLEEGLRLADFVTVASEGEREAVHKHAGVPLERIKLVPNGLHAQILGTPRDYENGFTNDGVLTIGWSGTVSSQPGLELCAKPLGRLAHTLGRDKVRIRLVGFQPQAAGPEALKHLVNQDPERVDIAYAEWVPHGHPYLSAVGQFDLWVAPYHATPFNEAKYPTKALEAGFWGIPLVTSDIRPYAEWFSTMHQADHPRLVSEYVQHEWGRQLGLLLRDAGLRRRHGEAARSRAAAYSLQEVGRQWEAALLE